MAMALRRVSSALRFLVAGLVVLAVATASVPVALASWQAVQDGNNWVLKSGNTKIPMPDQKTAESTAHKFNKIEQKADKRNSKDDKKGKDK